MSTINKGLNQFMWRLFETLARTLTHQLLIQNTQCVPALKKLLCELDCYTENHSVSISQISRCHKHWSPSRLSSYRADMGLHSDRFVLKFVLGVAADFYFIESWKRLKLAQSTEHQGLWLARLPQHITADQRTQTFKLKWLRTTNCKCEGIPKR